MSCELQAYVLLEAVNASHLWASNSLKSLIEHPCM